MFSFSSRLFVRLLTKVKCSSGFSSSPRLIALSYSLRLPSIIMKHNVCAEPHRPVNNRKAPIHLPESVRAHGYVFSYFLITLLCIDGKNNEIILTRTPTMSAMKPTFVPDISSIPQHVNIVSRQVIPIIFLICRVPLPLKIHNGNITNESTLNKRKMTPNPTGPALTMTYYRVNT